MFLCNDCLVGPVVARWNVKQEVSVSLINIYCIFGSYQIFKNFSVEQRTMGIFVILRVPSFRRTEWQTGISLFVDISKQPIYGLIGIYNFDFTEISQKQWHYVYCIMTYYLLMQPLSNSFSYLLPNHKTHHHSNRNTITVS